MSKKTKKGEEKIRDKHSEKTYKTAAERLVDNLEEKRVQRSDSYDELRAFSRQPKLARTPPPASERSSPRTRSDHAHKALQDYLNRQQLQQTFTSSPPAFETNPIFESLGAGAVSSLNPLPQNIPFNVVGSPQVRFSIPVKSTLSHFEPLSSLAQANPSTSVLGSIASTFAGGSISLTTSSTSTAVTTLTSVVSPIVNVSTSTVSGTVFRPITTFTQTAPTALVSSAPVIITSTPSLGGGAIHRIRPTLNVPISTAPNQNIRPPSPAPDFVFAANRQQGDNYRAPAGSPPPSYSFAARNSGRHSQGQFPRAPSQGQSFQRPPTYREPSPIMAQLTINEITDLIQVYDGNESTLNSYLCKTTRLWNQIPEDAGQAAARNRFMTFVQQKLIGKAAMVLEERDFDTWEGPTGLKQALQNSLQAHNMINITEHKMTNAVQKPHEDEYEFTDRIRGIKVEMMRAFRATPDREDLRSLIDQKARRSLEKGLSDPNLKRLTNNRGCSSFDECVDYVLDQASKRNENTPPRNNDRFCNYCKSNDHLISNCPRRPPINRFNPEARMDRMDPNAGGMNYVRSEGNYRNDNPNPNMANITCYTCGARGHISTQCRERGRNRGPANPNERNDRYNNPSSAQGGNRDIPVNNASNKNYDNNPPRNENTRYHVNKTQVVPVERAHNLPTIRTLSTINEESIMTLGELYAKNENE